MNSGIISGGNVIIDVIKRLETLPKAGALATIKSIEKSVGGGSANCLMDIARLDPAVPLGIVGLRGADAYGEFFDETLRDAGIDTSRLCVTDAAGTSFTDVMSAADTGERTFFHYRGANARLSDSDFDFDGMDCRILHMAYAMLLDTMDSDDPEYGTVMARTLHGAKERGIITALDVVSESTGRFAKVVPASLKYTDLCVINEEEASGITGLAAYKSEDRLDAGALREMLWILKRFGVSRWVVIHAPRAAFGLDETGRIYVVPSLSMPKELIKGKVGAGDAYFAGILFGCHAGMTLEDSMRLARATAVCSLTEANASDGLRPIAQVYDFASGFGEAEEF